MGEAVNAAKKHMSKVTASLVGVSASAVDSAMSGNKEVAATPNQPC